MVERRMELTRRYHRKKKMAKLKGRLAAAKDDKTREAVLDKIRLVSPFWKEPATKAAAPATKAKAKK
jgi:hypothetical protein